MTSRNSEINLVVRARTEGERAIDAMTLLVNKFLGAEQGAAKGAGDLVAALAAVDKSYATISAAADKGAAAFERQQKAIAANRAELAALKAQADAASAVIDKLKGTVGPQRPDQQKQLSANIAGAEAEHGRLQAQINRLGSTVEKQVTGTNSARSALQQLGSTAIAAGEQQAQLRAEVERQTAALDANAAAAARASAAQSRGASLQQFLAPRAPATENGATFDALAAQENAAAAAAARLRQELNPLIGLQAEFNAKQREANELHASGAITTKELGDRTAQLGAQMKRAEQDLKRQGKDSIGLFGLRPYEMTNLGYQINDVVTQIASGTSITQTIAQQGGQILQLLPNIGSKLLALATNPFFAAGAATFFGIAEGLKESADQSERLREFQSTLTASADGGSYDATALSKSVEALKRQGIAAKDSAAAMHTFIADGIQQERLEQFTIAARDMADVLGMKVADAAKQMGVAFSGGYDAIVKLDDATNFLSASEREHIRTLFDEGKASEARAEAFKVFAEKQNQAAIDARGPWSEAIRSLGTVWQSFIGWLTNTSVVNGMAVALDALANSATNLFDRLSGADRNKNLLGRIAQLQVKIGAAQGIADAEPTATDSQRAMHNARLQGIQELRRELAALQQQWKDLNAAAKAGDTEDANSQAKLKARSEALDELRRKRETDPDLKKTGTNAKRIEDAGKDAYDVEMRKSGDTVIADAARLLAVDKERAKVVKEIAEAEKQAAAAREKAIKDFEEKVVGAEGGAGKNPHSTAQGAGQFTNGTWLEQYKKVYGDTGRSDEQILLLRQNQAIAKGVIDNFTRENAKFLEGIGQKVTAGNLYLVHFLGQQGATNLFKASGDTPVDQIGLSAGALAGNQKYLRTDNGKGAYRTADQLKTFIAGRVGDTGAAQSGGVEALAALDKAQDDLNSKIDAENTKRLANIEALKIEGLATGEALLAAQKRKAIADAVLEAQQKYDEAIAKGVPIDVSDELMRLQIVQKTVAAEFDLAHQKEMAAAQREKVDRPVRDLTDQRDTVKEQQDYLRSVGDLQGAAALTPLLDTINAKLRDAQDLLIDFYKTRSPEQLAQMNLTADQIDAIVRKLEVAKQKSQEFGTVLGLDGKAVHDALANSISSGFDKFAQSVGQGKNVFKSLKDTFLDFGSSFLKMIAQMIIQAEAFSLATMIMKALGVPIPTAPAHHSGGIAGQGGGTQRAINPVMFSIAPRYHTGGIAGLAPDEVPAILRAGEEVLTRSDPRHRANGGAGGSAAGNVTLINTFDPAAAMEAALSVPAGERVLLNHVRDNAAAFKAVLG